MKRTKTTTTFSTRSSSGGTSAWGWLLSALFLSTAATATASLDNNRLLQKGGFIQSGPDAVGSSYATAVVFSIATNTIHVTGTTYGKFWQDDYDGQTAACFYASLFESSGEHTLEWLHTDVIGQKGVQEACHAMYLDDHHKHLYIIGTSSQEGILQEIGNDGTIADDANIVQYGMLLDMEYSDTTLATTTPKLVGGRLLKNDAIVYPIAVTSYPEDDEIYLVSMETDNPQRNEKYDDLTNPDPAAVFTYGTQYSMRVEAFQQSSLTATDGNGLKEMAELWPGKFYETKNGEFSVEVAGMVKIGPNLYVAGTTMGYGDGFGTAGQGNGQQPSLDGFVTKLSASNGKLYQDATDINPKVTLRIASDTNQDDTIDGICYSPAAKEDYVYVTGSTAGTVGGDTAAPPDGKVRAYLKRIDTSTMEAVWTVELQAQGGSDPAVRGISCAVTRDGTDVYVAGMVENGAVLPNTGIDASYGGTDVFVAKVQVSDGVVQYVRQMGSAGEDTIALRGGVVTDFEGDAIVVGNTNGEVFRTKTNTEDPSTFDVFAFVLDRKEGTFAHPSEHKDFDGFPSVPNPPPVSAPTPQTGQPKEQEEVSTSNGSGLEHWIILLFLLLLGIVAVVFAVYYLNAHFLPKREIATDRSKVLDYLHGFDVEDVDLKHSATGGWHCSYANGLSRGVNDPSGNRSPSSGSGLLLGNDSSSKLESGFDPLTKDLPSTSPPSLSGRDMMADSLFIIEDDDDDDGGAASLTFGRNRNSRRSPQYDGLHTAFNESWAGGDEPLSHHHHARGGGPKKSRSKRSERWGRDII